MKKVISCPNCSKKLRFPSNKNIKFYCDSCRTLIYANYGEVTKHLVPVKLASPPWHKHKLLQKIGNLFNNLTSLPKTVYAIIGLYFLVVFSIGLIEERRDFNTLKKSPNSAAIELFLEKHPDSKFNTEVQLLKDSIKFIKLVNSYQEQKEKKNFICNELKNYIEKDTFQLKKAKNLYEECLFYSVKSEPSFADIDKYRFTFENGIFKDSLDLLETTMFKNLNSQYSDKKDSKKISPKAKKFMTELLAFEAKSKKRKIHVHFDSKFYLKDWNDYSDKAKELSDSDMKFRKLNSKMDYPAPSEKPPPSIKTVLANSNTKFEKAVVEAIQNRLDAIFHPNPFEVEKSYIPVKAKDNAFPVISIQYEIQTLSNFYRGVEYPDLYVHTESADKLDMRIFKGFLLAAKIDWNMKFQIPDSDLTYNKKMSSQPESQLTQPTWKKEPYEVILGSAFENFGLLISEELGL